MSNWLPPAAWEDGYGGHPEQYPYGVRPLDDISPSELFDLMMRIMMEMARGVEPDNYRRIAVSQEFIDTLPASYQRHFEVRNQDGKR